jgi:hypothetical protein
MLTAIGSRTIRLHPGYVVLGNNLDGHRRTPGLGWVVTKCVTCHGTMHKEEKRCFLCGTNVAPDPNQVTLRQRFSSGVKGALIVSVVMTIASIFTDNYTPSFMKCMILTVILGLVKNSANQMALNR